MRKVLIQEGKVAPNNLVIAVGAIQFDPEHTYPVCVTSYSELPIGVIKNVSREGDELYGDIYWRPETIPPDENDYNLSVYCSDLKRKTDTPHIVEEAILRGFCVVPAMPAAARTWEPDVKI